jgi:ABC-2 type transport system ATP-binding protein
MGLRDGAQRNGSQGAIRALWGDHQESRGTRLAAGVKLERASFPKRPEAREPRRDHRRSLPDRVAERRVSRREPPRGVVAYPGPRSRAGTCGGRGAEYGLSPMPAILSISGLTKTYGSGLEALKRVDLTIDAGEIFALLGPNGAGKTTLISIVCGIVTPTAGTVVAGGHDIRRDYRAARAKIGLVPQELTTDAFETVWATVTFSRGLFGHPPSPAHIERVLRDLSLWDKRDDTIMTLSGGMKRRVMIAKALAHEPEILFLDEPTAGVDVELRRDMWALVRGLRERGVTIILTTHYIQEAEEMADRIGVIRKGELVLVEDKGEMMKKLGQKQLTLHLTVPLSAVPSELGPWGLSLSAEGMDLTYTFGARDDGGVSSLLRRASDLGLEICDLQTRQRSLEEIFVDLVREPTEGAA